MRIKLVHGRWHLLKNGTSIGHYRTFVEARDMCRYLLLAPFPFTLSPSQVR